MSRHRTWSWLAGLLVLGSGCVGPLVRPASSTRPGPAGAVSPNDLPNGQTPTSYRVRPAVPTLTAKQAGVTPIPTESPSQGTPRPVNWQRPAPKQEQLPVIERPAYLGPPIATPTPSPAHGEYSHAADYHWLIGCLSYDSKHNRWSVRYADSSERDRIGGTLELINPGPMRGFLPGQTVRVEGELVDPAPLEITPAYRVTAIQVMPH
jgi:hypothetical protein